MHWQDVCLDCYILVALILKHQKSWKSFSERLVPFDGIFYEATKREGSQTCLNSKKGNFAGLTIFCNQTLPCWNKILMRFSRAPLNFTLFSFHRILFILKGRELPLLQGHTSIQKWVFNLAENYYLCKPIKIPSLVMNSYNHSQNCKILPHNNWMYCIRWYTLGYK